MNRDEILEMIVKHTVSSRIEQGTDLIHEVYVNDFVDELIEAINVIHCCKSDSEQLRDEYLQPQLNKYKNIKVERTKGRSDM